METTSSAAFYMQTEPFYHCHVWEKVKRFTTWTSSNLNDPVSEWACWFIDYRCIICGHVVTLPEGKTPLGGIVESTDPQVIDHDQSDRPVGSVKESNDPSRSIRNDTEADPE